MNGWLRAGFCFHPGNIVEVIVLTSVAKQFQRVGNEIAGPGDSAAPNDMLAPPAGIFLTHSNRDDSVPAQMTSLTGAPNETHSTCQR